MAEDIVPLFSESASTSLPERTQHDIIRTFWPSKSQEGFYFDLRIYAEFL